MIKLVAKGSDLLGLLVAVALTGCELVKASPQAAKPPAHPSHDAESKSAEAQENKTMAQEPQASRPAPPAVAPVDYQGIRYQQEMQSYDYGGDQPGGYLTAIDLKTGQRLWMLKIYPVADNSVSGVESMGIYFKTMRLVPGRDKLDIEDETGRHFIFDLATKISTQVSEPPSNPMPAIKIPQ